MADIAELEFEIKVLQRSVTKLEADVRENYGLIKELHGKLITDQRLDNANKMNMEQERAIGQLQMGLELITKALARSNDKSLSDAADGIKDKITINVQGGASNATSIGKTDGDATLIEGDQHT